jgi:single-stranded DNA-binding protein
MISTQNLPASQARSARCSSTPPGVSTTTGAPAFEKAVSTAPVYGADLAGHCAQSLSKGMRVIATGRLSQRSYQAQDGTNRTVVEMTVDEIGPSLRYATAQVTKQGGHNGYQGGGTYGNPNGQPPQPPQQTTPPPASDGNGVPPPHDTSPPSPTRASSRPTHVTPETFSAGASESVRGQYAIGAVAITTSVEMSPRLPDDRRAIASIAVMVTMQCSAWPVGQDRDSEST